MKKKLVSAALLALLLAACGPTTETESMMIAWANVLNAHLASGGRTGDNFSYPTKLSQVNPNLIAGLSKEDAWGQKYLYRRILDDRYQLISAGPDGDFGNEDDIVVENGVTYEPMGIYAKRPLKKK